MNILGFVCLYRFCWEIVFLLVKTILLCPTFQVLFIAKLSCAAVGHLLRCWAPGVKLIV